MKFTKMHCCGNDFVIINCFNEKFEDFAKSAEAICDRNYGVGADGLILVFKSDLAQYKLRFFNPDGSEAETNASGVICAAKYLDENNYIDKEYFNIETLSGLVNVKIENEEVTANFCEPVFTPQLIPVDYTGDEFVDKYISVNNSEYAITCLSFGTPHAVMLCDDIYDLNVKAIGSKIEVHQIFPKRTNVDFVKIIDDKAIELRVWQRGAGETLSSGGGAVAALAALSETGKAAESLTVRCIGGDYKVFFDADGNVNLTATPEFAFSGEIKI